MIMTAKCRNYGQLEEQANAGDIEAFVFRNGEVVPADQAESAPGPVIHTAPEKNYGQLEEQANGNADVEEFVFTGGEIKRKDQTDTSNGPVIRTAPEPNFAWDLGPMHTYNGANWAGNTGNYWYEKENGSLLQFEKECFFQFMKEYNHPEQKLSFSYDNKKRFCVDLVIPFKAAPELPWRKFSFHIVYEHNHPGRDADGLFGGSIKVYPMTRLKPGFHHLISDSAMGLPYICQVRSTSSENVNGYKVMTRVLRWINVYCIWEKTGVDIDK